MKLHQIRDFLAVSRAGGVRAASRELGVSQPSISKSIQQLEMQLDVPLFERSRKGTVLTKFGEVLLVRAQGIANELERAEGEIRQLRGVEGGRVAVALSGTASMRLLPGTMRTFRRRWGNVDLTIDEAPYERMLAELRNGKLDFAVVPRPEHLLDEGISIQPILTDRRAVIARKGHPSADARSLRELAGASWIITGLSGSEATEFDAVFTKYKLPVPRVEIHCRSLLAILMLLANSDLLTLMPAQWLGANLTRPLLTEIAVRERVDALPICIVRRAGMPLTPAAEALATAFTVEAGAIGAVARREH